MLCPKCATQLPELTAACPQCGFCAAEVENVLGNQAATIEPIMDVAACLRLADRNKLEALLDDFERRFPQVHIALFVGVLPPPLTPATAGFWLLNHGVRIKHGKRRDNAMGILILIEPTSGQAGISLGYGLETLLPTSSLTAALQAATHHLQHANFGAAFRSIVRAIDRLIRKAATSRARGAPFVPVTPKPHHVPLGLPQHITRPAQLPPKQVKEEVW